MTAFFQTIRDSLLELLRGAILWLPGLLLASGVLWGITRYAVPLARKISMATGERILQSRSLRSLFVQAAVVTTWALGILAASVIVFPDLALGDLVAFLGLGSVAVGFAFQDIFKNFLAGVLLLLSEPFRLNDQVIVDAFEGTVEQIDIRSTQIRTYQGERVIIPNALVFTSPVRVLTDLPYRRVDLDIGLDYNTPLPQAIEVLLAAVMGVEEVFRHPAPEVDVVGFNDSSIDLMVRFWCQPRRPEVRKAQTQVMIALKAACDREHITIPYPIRTVYMFDQDQFKDCSRRPTAEAS
jgi:small conductance mechanosensitive channel